MPIEIDRKNWFIVDSKEPIQFHREVCSRDKNNDPVILATVNPHLSESDKEYTKNLISAAPELYHASLDFIDFIFNKYNISNESDIQCPKIAKLYRAVKGIK